MNVVPEGTLAIVCLPTYSVWSVLETTTKSPDDKLWSVEVVTVTVFDADEKVIPEETTGTPDSKISFLDNDNDTL